MRLAIVVLCFAASVVRAQPATTPPTSTPSTNTPPTSTDEKSPTTAVILSVGVPLVGAAVAVGSHGNGGALLFGMGALFLGPSTGRWYAGASGGGTIAIRGAGVLAVGAGIVGVYGISEADCRANDQPCHSPAPFEALAIGGATVIIGTWIYDIVQAKRGADRWNASHALTVTPGLVGTTTAPGMFVSGQF
jgi:hypothetical protein